MEKRGSFAGVYIFDVPYHADKEYTYSVPEKLEKAVSLGSLVVVPFGGGNRYRTGVVSSLFSQTQRSGIKPIISVPGTLFSLGELGIRLCLFMKDNFFCTVSEAARTILPAGLSVKRDVFYELCEDAQTQGLNIEAEALLSSFSKEKRISEKEAVQLLGDSAKHCLSYLEKKKILRRVQDVSCHINEKTESLVQPAISAQELEELLSSKSAPITEKQRYALECVAGGDMSLGFLAQNFGVSSAVVRALEKKGLVRIYKESLQRNPYKDISKQDMDFVLSSEQKSAYERLLELYMRPDPCAALLYGVTGSGKTNVILKLCDKAYEEKKSVIYLVPEIALVNQAYGLFSKRYGSDIIVIHSALSAGERTDAYKRAKQSEFCIVIGTRSAIFAPVNNLSLVVIDEEQDSSYKSEMTPKYHARDIARFICAKSNGMLLLSSATPSLESFYKAKAGKYELVCLKNRYGDAHLPNVIIEDMRNSPQFTSVCNEEDKVMPLAISEDLGRRLEDTVKQGRQAILFMNRRGYQAFARCSSCGYVFLCPNCSVSLTFHKNPKNYRHPEGEMRCHYCGFSSGVPQECPVCSSKHIGFMGTGTQLVEEYLNSRFEDNVLRMDTDTTSGKLSCDGILSDFRDKKAKILIGTQMVTKGHDFPDVSLVGVISADSLLYMNDFRANERTFSLLTQVLGRAGRGKVSGTAVIQTHNPEHLTLNLAAHQNYEAFYKDEIEFRKAAFFPPFCDIVTFELSSEDELAISELAKSFSGLLSKYAADEYKDVRMIVYGPFQAGIYKLLGRYRQRFIIKCRLDKRTKEMLAALYAEFLQNLPEHMRVAIDVNPQNL